MATKRLAYQGMTRALAVWMLYALMVSVPVSFGMSYPEMRDTCIRCNLDFCPRAPYEKGVSPHDLLPEEKCDIFRAYLDPMLKIIHPDVFPHCGTEAIKLFAFVRYKPCWDDQRKMLITDEITRNINN